MKEKNTKEITLLEDLLLLLPAGLERSAAVSGPSETLSNCLG